jgi:hypothetical protein
MTIPSFGSAFIGQNDRINKILTNTANGQLTFDQQGDTNITQTGVSSVIGRQSGRITEFLNTNPNSHSTIGVSDTYSSKNIFAGFGELYGERVGNIEGEFQNGGKMFVSDFGNAFGAFHKGGEVGLENGQRSQVWAKDHLNFSANNVKETDTTGFSGSGNIGIQGGNHHIVKLQDWSGNTAVSAPEGRLDFAAERGQNSLVADVGQFVGTQQGGELNAVITANRSSFVADGGKTSFAAKTNGDNLIHIQNGDALTVQESNSHNQLTGVNANIEASQRTTGDHGLNRFAGTDMHNLTLTQQGKGGESIATLFWGQPNH